MDWKTSLDTTFSDIWRGRNLRRLLTLWLVSLATLALYGTTTNSIPLPDIFADDESALSHGNQEVVARAAPDVAPAPAETRSTATPQYAAISSLTFADNEGVI